MWQSPSDKFWSKHAPLLFPVIGRLKNQEYELDGEMVHMPMHGFCRDRVFETVELDSTSGDLHTDLPTDNRNGKLVYGDGSCQIHAETVSGDVNINKQ